MSDIASMEYIRYVWGESSIGEFLAAWSGDGLVHLEFADSRTKALKNLDTRFSDCLIIEDVLGLTRAAETLGAIIEHPRDDIDLKIDLRGSEYEKRVWNILREIPAGTTVCYGDVAAKLGTRDARDSTAAIAANNIAVLVPCHRVIKKDGSISGYRWGVPRKKALLERERSDASPKIGS